MADDIKVRLLSYLSSSSLSFLPSPTFPVDRVDSSFFLLPLSLLSQVAPPELDVHTCRLLSARSLDSPTQSTFFRSKMKTIAAFAALLIASVAAAPFNSRRQAAVDEATIARLAPDLGAVPPLAPTGEHYSMSLRHAHAQHTNQASATAKVPSTARTASQPPCPAPALQRAATSSQCAPFFTCPPASITHTSSKALTTNVLAGKAVNNTGVLISYPTGDSVQDQLARITASAITLQNLVGPGKGCPLVATTLGVRSRHCLSDYLYLT